MYIICFSLRVLEPSSYLEKRRAAVIVDIRYVVFAGPFYFTRSLFAEIDEPIGYIDTQFLNCFW